MARARSVNNRSRSKSRGGVLPERLQIFLARRLVDIAAGIMFVGGLFLFLSLASYHHGDPSLNTAAEENVSNWAGQPGAWAADLLLQTIGGAAFALAVTFIVWGLRIFNRQSLRPFWARVIALLAATPMLCIAMAQIPAGDWLVHPFLGASAGTLMLENLAETAARFNLPVGRGMIVAVGALTGTASLLFACGVRFAEIMFVLHTLKNTVLFFAFNTYHLSRAFAGWISHYNDPSYRGESIKLFKMPELSWPSRDEEEVFEEEESEGESLEPAPLTRKTPVATVPELADTLANSAPHIPIVAPQKASVKHKDSTQQRFQLSDGDWELPSLSLLQDIPDDHHDEVPSEDSLRKNAQLLQNVLSDFNVQGDIVSIHPGPVVTLYELEPAPGTKTSRVISLSDDIARSMSAVSVRIAVVPGRNVIGIEMPNKTRQIVYMREMLESRLYEKSNARLPLILGKDISGQPIMADLAKMPHLLVAGTTGSGKSVAVNTMILSLLFRLSPEQCRFIMIDPKMLELSVYDDIPHLLSPVVTEPGKAVVALKWAVNEMEERYRAMSKLGVRNIEGYNTRMREALKKGETLSRQVQTGFDPESGKPVYEEQPMNMSELPYIVIVVDEFADLMLVAGKDVENAIQRLAQMARAAGIHLIMATQRPSVDVITGVIKANFPTRISFAVTSKIDSRTILGEGGAEQLLGMGDMLYMAPGGRITRVHGPFVSDGDVQKVTDSLRAQGSPAYLEDITEGGEFGGSEVMGALFGEGGGDNSVDELYDHAVAIVAREGKVSTSFIQRHLQIGYNRAARIVEEMERQGIISAASPTGKREILVRDFSDV